MKSFQASAYGPIFAELLAGDRLNPLGPGEPNQAMRPKLEGMGLTVLFDDLPIHDLEMARGCLAGLWLLHDFLDESHKISQELNTPTGSYWHGIMHRREPDYWNSKYWFRRVGDHPVFKPLHGDAANLTAAAGAPKDAAFLTRQSAWDPLAFADLCERAAKGTSPLEDLCRKIQRREWELLFDYCHNQAIGE